MTLALPSTMIAAYDAARAAAALYRVPGAGYLRIAGADRADFIQRQTTNDVQRLAPGRALLSVLTSGTARTLDVWRLLPDPGDPDAIGAITLPGRAPATAAYLQGRIFFMDQVTVTDTSAEWAQIELRGPDVPRVLVALGLDALPEPGAIAAWDAGGVSLHAVGLQGIIARGVLLLVPAADAEAITGRLADAGAATLAPEAHAVLRVEDGLPGPARELASDFTPLEANLDAAIADAKGCYAGQEVIARQITYDKVARRLVGLRLDAPVPIGARVEVDGRRAGEITSAALSPRFGPLALAVLRRAYCDPGQDVSVIGESGSVVAGRTSALPFDGAG